MRSTIIKMSEPATSRQLPTPNQQSRNAVDLSRFILLDTARMNVLGTDVRSAKKFTASTKYPDNTVIYMFMPAEYSTDTIVPNVGHLFLGAINRPSAGISTDTLTFTINGQQHKCRNVFGYLRPDKLPIELSKTTKIRLGTKAPTDMLELAFLASPNAETLYTNPLRTLPVPPPIDPSDLDLE